MTTAITAGAEFFRTFEPQLEVRAPSKGGDGRTVEGIAVPFLFEQRIDEYLTEQFHPRAFSHQLKAAHRVPFTLEHLRQGGTPIGRTIEMRADAAGLWGAWRVARTRDGDDALALIEDGPYAELSIGFVEDVNHREPNGTITRIKAHLREVSLVMAGAYGQAASVLAVRSADDQARRGVTTYRQPSAGVDEVSALLRGFKSLPDPVE